MSADRSTSARRVAAPGALLPALVAALTPRAARAGRRRGRHAAAQRRRERPDPGLRRRLLGSDGLGAIYESTDDDARDNAGAVIADCRPLRRAKLSGEAAVDVERSR